MRSPLLVVSIRFSPQMASPFLLFLLFLLIPVIILFLILCFLTRPKPVRIPIKGRHVFITGGSSGIGLALAKSAAAEGARVSILARNATRLEEAKESIKLATGCEVSVFSADVRNASAVQQAIDEAGPVDVLICNQGVFVPLELEKQELEAVKGMIDVNLMGTFHLIKAVLPGMKIRARDKPASIAIMSSQAGQVGVYGYTAYSASKFALRGLAESLQHEVISDNIHISMIFPPDTETPGLTEEMTKRPKLTTMIAAASGGVGMNADDVAKKALDGLKRGQFTIPCNFDGAMLAIATAGLSPQRSSLMALCEIFAIGFMRLIGLGYQWKWFSIIEKHRNV